MQHEMHVLGIDIAKRVLYTVEIDDRGSCIRPLRIMHAAQEPAIMPSLHRSQWGRSLHT
jgi:hypothetical protein